MQPKHHKSSYETGEAGCARLRIVGGFLRAILPLGSLPCLLHLVGLVMLKVKRPGTADALEHGKGDAPYGSPIPSFLFHFSPLSTAI